jgi:hypothetical protein
VPNDGQTALLLTSRYPSVQPGPQAGHRLYSGRQGPRHGRPSVLDIQALVASGQADVVQRPVSPAPPASTTTPPPTSAE